MRTRRSSIPDQTDPDGAAAIRLDDWARKHAALEARVAQQETALERARGVYETQARRINDAFVLLGSTSQGVKGLPEALAILTENTRIDRIARAAAEAELHAKIRRQDQGLDNLIESIITLTRQVQEHDDAQHAHPTEGDSAADETAASVDQRLDQIEGALQFDSTIGSTVGEISRYPQFGTILNQLAQAIGAHTTELGEIREEIAAQVERLDNDDLDILHRLGRVERVSHNPYTGEDEPCEEESDQEEPREDYPGQPTGEALALAQDTLRRLHKNISRARRRVARGEVLSTRSCTLWAGQVEIALDRIGSELDPLGEEG